VCHGAETLYGGHGATSTDACISSQGRCPCLCSRGDCEEEEGRALEDEVIVEGVSGLDAVEAASELPVDRQGGSVIRKWGARVSEKSRGVVLERHRSVE
jgi:hypothetical protein